MKKPFNEIFEDITKRVTRIKKSDYLSKGNHIIVDQGQESVAGYTNHSKGLYTEVPIIVFGDHTRIIKYIDTPFFIGADGIKVLRCRIENVNYRYLYYALKAIRIPNTGYNRHFKWLRESFIPYPSLNQQDQIVRQLDGINSLIELQKQKTKLLDELMASKFVELFGLPVSNTKGWKTQQMKTVAPEVNHTGSLSEKVWLLNLDQIEPHSGRVIDYLYVKRKDIGNSTCTFDTTNVLFSKLRPYLNKVVIPDRCGYASSELVPLQPVQTLINREYLAFMLRNTEFVYMISNKITGARMPRVSMNEFRRFEVPVPPLVLQNQFTSFTENVNKMKELYQKKIDSYEELLNKEMKRFFST